MVEGVVIKLKTLPYNSRPRCYFRGSDKEEICRGRLKGAGGRWERACPYRVSPKTFLASASKRGSPRIEYRFELDERDTVSVPILARFFEQLQRFVFLGESDVKRGRISIFSLSDDSAARFKT
jgi:hypothetical protein